jgi:hypothetical protein
MTLAPGMGSPWASTTVPEIRDCCWSAAISDEEAAAYAIPDPIKRMAAAHAANSFVILIEKNKDWLINRKSSEYF